MQVITIAQQKGGAGKTTVAAHLAVGLALHRKRVTIIDIDPQGSLANWYVLREQKYGANNTGLNFVVSAGWRVESAISNLKGDVDYIIIDAPPHTETESKTAIRASNLVIVPMQLSPTDLWASSSTMEFANSEKINVKILLNRYNPQSKLSKELFSQMNGDLFNCSLGNRVAFSTCFLNGTTAVESEPNSLAALEVRALCLEVLTIFEPNNANKGKNAMDNTKRAFAKT